MKHPRLLLRLYKSHWYKRLHSLKERDFRLIWYWGNSERTGCSALLMVDATRYENESQAYIELILAHYYFAYSHENYQAYLSLSVEEMEQKAVLSHVSTGYVGIRRFYERAKFAAMEAEQFKDIVLRTSEFIKKHVYEKDQFSVSENGQKIAKEALPAYAPFTGQDLQEAYVLFDEWNFRIYIAKGSQHYYLFTWETDA